MPDLCYFIVKIIIIRTPSCPKFNRTHLLQMKSLQLDWAFAPFPLITLTVVLLYYKLFFYILQ